MTSWQAKMSSNYRILAYFLSTLEDSLRVGLGLRNTRNYYNRLSHASRSEQIKNAPKRSNANVYKTNQNVTNSKSKVRKNVNFE